MAPRCCTSKMKSNKFLMFAFLFMLVVSEYYVINEPQTMLRPPKNGVKNDYGPLPSYMLKKMIRKSLPLIAEYKVTVPEIFETKAEVPRDKEQEYPHVIRPLPGQTEEDQVTLTVDLDELYLKDTHPRIKTILAYFFLLGLELAVIGYFFGYPIYLDRIEYAKFCEREKELAAEKLEKRRLRKTGRRRSKKKLT